MSTGRMMSTAQDVTLEIEGRRVVANGFSSRFLAPPPPIETLPKRERDRILGYLQIRQENAAKESHPMFTYLTSFEKYAELQMAAHVYEAMNKRNRPAGTHVDAMIRELADLSGHSHNTVAGSLVAWGKGKKPSDWKAIWTGE